MSLTSTELRTNWSIETPFQTHAVLPSEIERPNAVTKADVIEYMIGYVRKLRGSVEANRKKIENLTKLFNVVRGGNNISTTHQIVFNQSGNIEHDEMSLSLMKQFITDYGLNLMDIEDTISQLVANLEEMEKAPVKEFCEIDIFARDEKPVEC